MPVLPCIQRSHWACRWQQQGRSRMGQKLDFVKAIWTNSGCTPHCAPPFLRQCSAIRLSWQALGPPVPGVQLPSAWRGGCRLRTSSLRNQTLLAKQKKSSRLLSSHNPPSSSTSHQTNLLRRQFSSSIQRLLRPSSHPSIHPSLSTSKLPPRCLSAALLPIPPTKLPCHPLFFPNRAALD